MTEILKGFRAGERTTVHIANASDRLEAKPNGSNEKVSLQFVVKIVIEEEEQWQVTEFFIARERKEVFEPLALLEQAWRIFITLETRLQFIILEEEVERSEIWTEGVAVSRARDA